MESPRGKQLRKRCVSAQVPSDDARSDHQDEWFFPVLQFHAAWAGAETIALLRVLLVSLSKQEIEFDMSFCRGYHYEVRDESCQIQ